jgi:aminoglycoside phosphotransferase (APT) family kinase protein
MARVGQPVDPVPPSLAGLDRLEPFLRERFHRMSGPLAVARTAGGMSNPTFYLTAGDWSAVLRGTNVRS